MDGFVDAAATDDGVGGFAAVERAGAFVEETAAGIVADVAGSGFGEGVDDGLEGLVGDERDDFELVLGAGVAELHDVLKVEFFGEGVVDPAGGGVPVGVAGDEGDVVFDELEDGVLDVGSGPEMVEGVVEEGVVGHEELGLGFGGIFCGGEGGVEAERDFGYWGGGVSDLEADFVVFERPLGGGDGFDRVEDVGDSEHGGMLLGGSV